MDGYVSYVWMYACIYPIQSFIHSFIQLAYQQATTKDRQRVKEQVPGQLGRSFREIIIIIIFISFLSFHSDINANANRSDCVHVCTVYPCIRLCMIKTKKTPTLLLPTDAISKGNEKKGGGGGRKEGEKGMQTPIDPDRDRKVH